MSIQIRAGLKKLIPVGLWPFFRGIDKYVIDVLYIYFAIRRFLARKTVRHIHPLCQSIPRITSFVHFGSETSSDNLVHRFEKEDLSFKSGRHSVYIYRHEDIARINPDLFHRYPHPFGLKIIKSREMSPDSTPYYTSRHLAPASSWFSMFAVGSIKDKMVISNLLATEEVAPRVYDLLKLKSEDGGWQYALVVEHLAGGVVTGRDGIEFIVRFTSALKKLGMQTLSIKEHCDLRPPDFRHNIVKGSLHACYVDIQNFVMFHSVFLNEVFSKAEHFRKVETSPMVLDSLLETSREQQREHDLFKQNTILLKVFLEQQGLYIENLVLVDISNSSGLFAIFCLHLGARWCVMVREETRVEWFDFYLTLLGFSRFQVVSSIKEIDLCRDDMLHEGKGLFFLRKEDLESKKVDQFLQTKYDFLIIETKSSDSRDICETPLTQLSEQLVSIGFFPLLDYNETVLCWNLFLRK